MDEIRERHTLVHESPSPSGRVVDNRVDYVAHEDRGLSGGAIAAIIIAILLTAIVITLIIVNSQQANRDNEIALERERAAAAERNAAQSQAAQPQQPQQPPVVVMPQVQPTPVPVPAPTTPSTGSTSSTTTPSNISLEVDVNAKFLDDAQLAAYPITVKADNGVVTLSGDVPSEELKAHAKELAFAVKGVRRVINDLKVKEE